MQQFQHLENDPGLGVSKFLCALNLQMPLKRCGNNEE